MEIKANRLGKFALLAAMTDAEEERVLRASPKAMNGYRLAITVISGLTSEVKHSFVKAIVSCAIQNGIIEKDSIEAHAVLHAALDALNGVVRQSPAEGSIKMKVAVASDAHWVAVAIYGDSAFLPLTNHERASMSLMHLRS